MADRFGSEDTPSQRAQRAIIVAKERNKMLQAKLDEANASIARMHMGTGMAFRALDAELRDLDPATEAYAIVWRCRDLLWDTLTTYKIHPE